MTLTSWNNFEGGFCFTEWWKVGWCEVRWIRRLADFHQSAYPWDCANRLGAGLRVPHLHESSPGRHSALSGHQLLTLATVPEFRAAGVCPLFDHLQGSHAPPPPLQLLIPFENTLASYGFICTNTFTTFCVFCSSCLPLAAHFVSPRQRNCSYATLRINRLS